MGEVCQEKSKRKGENMNNICHHSEFRTDIFLGKQQHAMSNNSILA